MLRELNPLGLNHQVVRLLDIVEVKLCHHSFTIGHRPQSHHLGDVIAGNAIAVRVQALCLTLIVYFFEVSDRRIHFDFKLLGGGEALSQVRRDFFLELVCSHPNRVLQ